MQGLVCDHWEAVEEPHQYWVSVICVQDNTVNCKLSSHCCSPLQDHSGIPVKFSFPNVPQQVHSTHTHTHTHTLSLSLSL